MQSCRGDAHISSTPSGGATFPCHGVISEDADCVSSNSTIAVLFHPLSMASVCARDSRSDAELLALGKMSLGGFSGSLKQHPWPHETELLYTISDEGFLLCSYSTDPCATW